MPFTNEDIGVENDNHETRFMATRAFLVTSPRQLDEMFRGGVDYCSWPNSPIESHKSAIVPDCQRKQVSIRDLLRAEQLAVIEDPDISETDIVRPEAVIAPRPECN